MPITIPNGAPTPEWLNEHADALADGYVVTVTPAMATTWLKQNEGFSKKNRRLRPGHAQGLALEMRKGQWRLTHQGIAFSPSGRLIDGQHRLTAIVQSGASCQMLVFPNVAEDHFVSFDRGATRSIADVMALDGLSATVATILVRAATRGSSSAGTGAKPAPIELEQVLTALTDDTAAMRTASTAHRIRATYGAVRGAWLLRHHTASPAEKSLLVAQWRAFADFDVKRMDETTAAGERRLGFHTLAGGGGRELESMCVGWRMFDPARRDLSVVRVTNMGAIMDEVRAAILAMCPGLIVARVAAATAAKTLRIYPMADPVTGPLLRAKAAEARARKAEKRV